MEGEEYQASQNNFIESVHEIQDPLSTNNRVFLVVSNAETFIKMKILHCGSFRFAGSPPWMDIQGRFEHPRISHITPDLYKRLEKHQGQAGQSILQFNLSHSHEVSVSLHYCSKNYFLFHSSSLLLPHTSILSVSGPTCLETPRMFSDLAPHAL